jgi:hypothetical protein
MERNRIPDVVRVCEVSGYPLARAGAGGSPTIPLRRKDVGTPSLYQLASADRERWAHLVDV